MTHTSRIALAILAAFAVLGSAASGPPVRSERPESRAEIPQQTEPEADLGGPGSRSAVDA